MEHSLPRTGRECPTHRYREMICWGVLDLDLSAVKDDKFYNSKQVLQPKRFARAKMPRILNLWMAHLKEPDMIKKWMWLLQMDEWQAKKRTLNPEKFKIYRSLEF